MLLTILSVVNSSSFTMDNPGFKPDMKMHKEMAGASEILVGKRRKRVHFEDDVPTKNKNEVGTDIQMPCAEIASGIPVAKKMKRVHFEDDVPTKIKNEVETDIQMPCAEIASAIAVGKKKKTVHFEDDVPTKVMCSALVEENITELTSAQTVNYDINLPSGLYNNAQQITLTNITSKPLLKKRGIGVFFLSAFFVFWLIIHVWLTVSSLKKEK